MESLPTQWIIAILAVFAVQWIKGSKIPGPAAGKSGTNTIFGALVAAVTAMGIHYEFNAAAGTLLFTGLTSKAALGGLWAFAQQWGWQQFAWKMLKEKFS